MVCLDWTQIPWFQNFPSLYYYTWPLRWEPQCLFPVFAWLLCVLNQRVDRRALESTRSTFKVCANKFQFIPPLGDRFRSEPLNHNNHSWVFIWRFGSVVSIYCENWVLSKIVLERPLGSHSSLETDFCFSVSRAFIFPLGWRHDPCFFPGASEEVAGLGFGDIDEK